MNWTFSRHLNDVESLLCMMNHRSMILCTAKKCFREEKKQATMGHMLSFPERIWDIWKKQNNSMLADQCTGYYEKT